MLGKSKGILLRRNNMDLQKLYSKTASRLTSLGYPETYRTVASYCSMGDEEALAIVTPTELAREIIGNCYSQGE